MGDINLKPSILRFFYWSNDFNPQTQVESHAQIWVRLLNLPQEYWRKMTLFEIASSISTFLTIYEATRSRIFAYFARFLVDVDMFEKLFDSVLVERDSYAFSESV